MFIHFFLHASIYIDYKKKLNITRSIFKNYYLNCLSKGFYSAICLKKIQLQLIINNLVFEELEKEYFIERYEDIPYELYQTNLIRFAEVKYSTQKRLIVEMSVQQKEMIHPSLNVLSKDDSSLQYVTGHFNQDNSIFRCWKLALQGGHC